MQRRRSLATCMAAQRRERNVITATFCSNEADTGLRLLPQARPSSNLTLTSRSMQGRESGMHSHGGGYGSDALGNGTTTAMAQRPLPWLRLRQWVVGEVKEVMALRCVRCDEWWCGGCSERAWQRCGGDGATLWFTWERRGRERGKAEVSESERGGRTRE